MPSSGCNPTDILCHMTNLVVALGDFVQVGFRGFVKKWVPRGSPLGVGIQGTVVHQEGVLMV